MTITSLIVNDYTVLIGRYRFGYRDVLQAGSMQTEMHLGMTGIDDMPFSAASCWGVTVLLPIVLVGLFSLRCLLRRSPA
jgi:hypothetical protein